ncbi:hypothetical protein [Paenibacillus mucilaginosus]|uniref:hypothetical protein n=1 Tax=Paenibacillus mucilaginosus TaxID=61624 RepID=UPI00059F6019|nr:hypothetical protein [Paenibacillus mucilaginosus]MCG7212758.1 hypothetical protein [Paenibacillus mucilaginosus]WDM25228.1 hypothetical protein KCX80_22515 [Paenibacillus mucilaginosus]
MRVILRALLTFTAALLSALASAVTVVVAAATAMGPEQQPFSSVWPLAFFFSLGVLFIGVPCSASIQSLAARRHDSFARTLALHGLTGFLVMAAIHCFLTIGDPHRTLLSRQGAFLSLAGAINASWYYVFSRLGRTWL